jgi:hypothetical protein
MPLQLGISALYCALTFTFGFLLAQTWACLATKPMEDTSHIGVPPSLVICEEGRSTFVKNELERQVLEDTSSNIQATTLDPPYPNPAKRARTSRDYKRLRRNNVKANTAARREPRKERRTPAAKPSTSGNSDGLSKYDDYRSRQRRGCGHGRQPKWPDELESAFIEGLSSPERHCANLARLLMAAFQRLTLSDRWEGRRFSSTASTMALISS